MKQLFTILSIALLSTWTSGVAISESQDQRSTEILKDVSKTYNTYKSIKAAFTVEVFNKVSNQTSKQSGTLYVKGKKFRVDMAGQELYCDGKNLWTYLKDANEVQVSKFDEVNTDIDPSKLFTIYQKGFAHKFAGESTVNGTKVNVIELTPVDKNKGFFKVKLNINKLSNKVENMSIYSKNGIITTYHVDTFSPNVDIKETFFKFNKASKPGVIEIDLR